LQEDAAARKSLVSAVEVSSCTDYVGVVAQHISDPAVLGGSCLSVVLALQTVSIMQSM